MDGGNGSGIEREGRSKRHKTRLGLSMLIRLNEGQERRIEACLLEHTALLEGMLDRLRYSCIEAYNFSGQPSSKNEQLTQRLHRSSSRFVRALIKHLVSSNLNKKAPLLWHDLLLNATTVEYKSTLDNNLQKMCEALEEMDTKSTNFFLSTVITAVLTYHLGWIYTALPRHDRQLMQKLGNWCPCNPLWAQLNDLHGALGTPVRTAQTIITGGETNLAQVNATMNFLTYFLRSGIVHVRSQFRKPEDVKRDVADAIRIVEEKMRSVLSKKHLRKACTSKLESKVAHKVDCEKMEEKTSGEERTETEKMEKEGISYVGGRGAPRIRARELADITKAPDWAENHCGSGRRLRRSATMSAEFTVYANKVEAEVNVRQNAEAEVGSKVKSEIESGRRDIVEIKDKFEWECTPKLERKATGRIEARVEVEKKSESKGERGIGNKVDAVGRNTNAAAEKGVIDDKVNVESEFDIDIARAKAECTSKKIDKHKHKKEEEKHKYKEGDERIGKYRRKDKEEEEEEEEEEGEEGGGEVGRGAYKLEWQGEEKGKSSSQVLFTLGEEKEEKPRTTKPKNCRCTHAFAYPSTSAQLPEGVLRKILQRNFPESSKSLEATSPRGINQPGHGLTCDRCNARGFPLVRSYESKQMLETPTNATEVLRTSASPSGDTTIESGGLSRSNSLEQLMEASNVVELPMPRSVKNKTAESKETGFTHTLLQSKVGEDSSYSWGLVLQGLIKKETKEREECKVRREEGGKETNAGGLHEAVPVEGEKVAEKRDVASAQKPRSYFFALTKQEKKVENEEGIMGRSLKAKGRPPAGEVEKEEAKQKSYISLLRRRHESKEKIIQENKEEERRMRETRRCPRSASLSQSEDGQVATFERDWWNFLREECLASVRFPIIDQPVAEAVRVLADVDTWRVGIVSNNAVHAQNCPVAVGMSKLVSNMLEAFVYVWKKYRSTSHCIGILEAKLKEMWLKSEAVAEMLMFTEFCEASIENLTNALDLDAADIPLLLAVATSHTPEIAQRFGLTLA